MTDIARAVRVALAQRGWSQKDLAEKMGKTKSYISLVCTPGRSIHITTINEIAQALGIKTSDLVKLGESEQ